eukprot:CAMPEP_0174930920 /NCGR_PEP_ID=MMETSP1355-20121228/31584_1 /TAXON_ID=464990 /ORGANISM="Hemiselmis tepida, Strain CCMP443" /LENGTH=104 /DNA_ID=CAMNT_0016177239 /DNA_START=55 /DNA_END=366 /DNA_ORIENTATION=+
MGGHWHDSRAGGQNVGNHIGDRSSVRQSKLYRQYESGNQIKDLLGQGCLKWDENKKQGAYSGPVFDHNRAQAGLKPTGRDGLAHGYGFGVRSGVKAQPPPPAAA